MTMWKWSRTAASNNTADSTVNLREGQGPSTLNDSARAMMAAVAKYRDDLGGTIATGGTSTAYTVTSYQSYSSLADGRIVAFTPHATNGDNPTLNVDSLGAKPLRAVTATALGAGSLIAGTPYVAVYRLSTDEWMLHGYYSAPSAIPIGSLVAHSVAVAPNSLFVLPYGQAISRTTYATLFNMVSSDLGSNGYGVGDGSTTFNVLDLRGRVIAGLDNMGGSSANRLTGLSGGVNGDTLGATGGAESHALAAGENAAHTHTGTTGAGGAHSHNYQRRGAAGGADGTGSAVNHASTETTTATTSESSHTHAFTTDSQGSGTAHNNVQPTIILPYILRVI